MLTTGTALRLRRSLHPLPCHVQCFRELSGGDTWQSGGALTDVHDPKHTTVNLRHPTFAMWGANTDIGKTLISAGLAQAFAQDKDHFLFLKPVQTGFPADCDSRLVAAALGIAPSYGRHAEHLLPAAASGAGTSAAGGYSSDVETDAENAAPVAQARARTTFAWQQPVSPHVAVQREGRGVSDGQVQAAVAGELHRFSCSIPQGARAAALVETAGGVASPGPSGSLQCDILRPGRLPAVLVGDGRLGGISSTIAAYEVLRNRGYDVPAIVVMDDSGGNCDALGRHFKREYLQIIQLPVCGAPPAPPLPEEHRPLPPPGGLLDEALALWLADSREQFAYLAEWLRFWHEDRVAELGRAADAARQTLWWPFTQHISVDDVMVIDSRCGEDFSAFSLGGGGTSVDAGSPTLAPRFDACASWWTQGTSAEVHPRLAAAVSHAAGRYGHVMFPENAHQPALDVAERLLATVGDGWASRVFYSDDGSTAVEVALKMAFRKFGADRGLTDDAMAQLQVVGLGNAYHGDTLGAMCAVPGSPFNGPRQMPWYTGRGLFLEPPSVGMSRGVWRVTVPPEVAGAALPPEFESRDAIFDAARDSTPLAEAYRTWVGDQLDSQEGATVGAAIIEPVLQGSGGMVLVDPLFQRTLVAECRARNIPVIFDEVFSGLWRLGAPSAAELLGARPDIACYAKLLTGGLLPLAVTLASKEVFDVFSGPNKTDALLHGHSYTAHPMGCAAAVAAMEIYADPASNPNQCRPAAWDEYADILEQSGHDLVESTATSPAGSESHYASGTAGAGRVESDGGCCGRSPACEGPCGRLVELWDPDLLLQLSHHPAVERCHALGTVLAAEIRAEDGHLGYSSGAARAVCKRLAPHGIYARPLGNVVYLMVTPTTARSRCNRLLRQLLAEL